MVKTTFDYSDYQSTFTIPLLLLAGEPAPGPQPARQPAADPRELPLPHLGIVQLCAHTTAEKVTCPCVICCTSSNLLNSNLE